MDAARTARLGSVALAGLVLFPVVLAFAPSALGDWTPVGGPLLVRVLFAGFPLAVVGRALVTRSPADAVLATFAVPCLLLSAWVHYREITGSSGLDWGDAVLLVTGTLLAIVVLLDDALARLGAVERRRASG